MLCISLFQEKIPPQVYAAARGAAIEDVIPAANKPIAKKLCAHDPKAGSRPFAISITLDISTPIGKTAAAQITIYMEISPVTVMASRLSFLAAPSDSAFSQCSCTAELCKKRL